MKLFGAARQPRVRYAAQLAASALGVGAVLWLVLLTGALGPGRYAIGTPADARTAVSFWPRQTNEEGGYRWTDGDSRLVFYGYERFSQVLMTARVKGPTGGPIQQFAVRVPASSATFSATATPGWRVYQLFVPRDAVGWTTPAMHITGPVFKPAANDSRALGVAMSLATIAPLGSPSLPGAILRALFLTGTLFAAGLGLGLARGLRWAWLVPLGLGGPLLLAMRAPNLGYWLPSAWTALLLALAAMGLPAGLRALQRRIPTPRPGIIGAGLALLGTSLLALREDLRWAGGLILVAGSLLAAAAPRHDDEPAPRRPWRAAILLGALAVAGAARLIKLDSIPFGLWRDEARYGLTALRILHEPGYRPVYVPGGIDYPGLLMYLTASAIKLVGVRIETVRLVAAVAGALMPISLYAFGRHLVGGRAALFASVMVAAAAWHIALSRISFVAVLEPLLTVSGLALLWSALHMPQRSRRRWLWFASAGLGFGLALYTYHTARILPALVLLLLLTVLGRSSMRWRAALPGVLLTGAVMSVVVAPLAYYALSNGDDFNLRMEQTALLRGPEEQAQSPISALNENLRRYTLMWHVQGEPNPRHYIPGRPMLDPIIGACFLIGLLLPGAAPSRRFVLGWLLLELIPPMLAEGAPHAVRAVGTIAPALLLAGVGLEHCLRFGTARYRQGIVGAGFVIIVLFNLGLYFRTIPYSPAVWDRFYVPETAMADYARTTASATPVLVPRDLLKTDVGAYLLDNIPVQTWSPNTPLAPQPANAQILVPDRRTEAEQDWVNQNLAGLQPTVGARYPGLERPVYWIYTLP